LQARPGGVVLTAALPSLTDDVTLALARAFGLSGLGS
jgi:hypothetical protein